MGTRIRRYAESLTLLTMIILGILVIINDFVPIFSVFPLPDGQKLTLILAILTTVTIFLLLELGRFQLLDDHTKSLNNIDNRLAKLDLDAIAQQLKYDHYSGVVAVHKRLDEEGFIRHMQYAKEITILNTWIPHLDRFMESLEEALNRRAVVKILLLYPNSEVAQLRDEALRTSPNPVLGQNVKQGVENCLDVINYILARIEQDKKSYLKVKFYNSLPSISVYRADQQLFVSVFFHGQLAINSPQFEIEGTESVLGKVIKREIDTLWEIGQELDDLAEWRSQIDLMADKF